MIDRFSLLETLTFEGLTKFTPTSCWELPIDDHPKMHLYSQCQKNCERSSLEQQWIGIVGHHISLDSLRQYVVQPSTLSAATNLPTTYIKYPEPPALHFHCNTIHLLISHLGTLKSSQEPQRLRCLSLLILCPQALSLLFIPVASVRVYM
jgi:hypothetical protein